MVARFAIAATALALSVIVSGCAGSGRAYEGVPVPREAIAVIKGSHSIIGNWFLIDVVDGKVFSPSVKEVEVLPGRRSVTFKYMVWVHCIPLIECLSPTLYAYRAVAEIDVEAGHTYRLRGEGSWADRPHPIHLYIVDTATNEVIWQAEIDSNKPHLILK